MELNSNVDNILNTNEVKEMYRLVNAYGLKEEAIKMLQIAINKKRSEVARINEKRMPISSRP